MNCYVFYRITKKFGTTRLADIAKEFNVMPQVMSNWKSRDQVPYKYVKQLRLKIENKKTKMSIDPSTLYTNFGFVHDKDANDDAITINNSTNIVKIEGAINSPGNYQYVIGKNFNDYIKMAGGLTKEASKYATYVKYPNGTSAKISFFKFSPSVEAECIITVGRKEEVEPFDMTEYVSNLTEIYTDLSQSYLMILLLSRQ